MEIFYGIENFNIAEKDNTCVTVGTFDGLHIGHKVIINTLIKTAKENGLKSVVLTFDPHPRQVLFPEHPLNLILTPNEKIEAFKNTGIDILVIHPFNKEFASKTCFEFMKNILTEKLKMRYLISGFNNHFGCDRLSDPKTLIEYGKKLSFKIQKIDAKIENGISASSTLIRESLLKGDIEFASKILGYKYYITGIVEKGRQIGTKIGFPTANISADSKGKLLPYPGAYIADIEIDNSIYHAMVNVGNNPTISSENIVTVEVNILNFNQDIYGKKVKVFFYKKIRNEIKFNSISQLQEALFNDKKTVEKYFG
ncbi:MAG: bifunctional riboflavin kinase/FAD synthetase [Bacteroidales bacterium]|nr:bifunctional riboflavin kinase/FAD synthetase [Bacteroidales bacterium]